MIRVVLLGAGNVATHLLKAFSTTRKVEVVQLYARTKKSLLPFKNIVATTNTIDDLVKADVYIIAVADDAIKEVSATLSLKNALIVHTSGSVEMNALAEKLRKGVFYPLQTFTKETTVDFSTIPICIEAEHNNDLLILEKLASSISEAVYFIDSKQRESLHTAAVFVNNFTNHLYHIGKQICDQNNVPFEVLKPLIKETAIKIKNTSPFDAQTGPAKRKDTNTITKHLHQLPENYKEIYSLLTRSISNTHEQKL